MPIFLHQVAIFLSTTPPNRFRITRKPYKSGLMENLLNWLNVAESLEC